MRDWDALDRVRIEDQEREIQRLESTNGPIGVIREKKEWLEKTREEYSSFQKLWAEKKAAAARATAADAQQQADFADEYAEEHDDDAIAERAELADQYAQAQGYPAAGSFLGLLQPVFDLFESAPKGAAAPEPTGKSMPESPNGEPLAAVSIRTLLGPPDTNSSKF